MPELNLSGINPTLLEELATYHEVSVSDTGLVKARAGKNGKWQSGAMGLSSWTAEEIARTHRPGVYMVKVPTPAEREQARATAAQAANEARGSTIPNPWAKGSFNLTQQLILADQDPALTSRFKQEAGVR
jgi:hypothetical protein